MADDEVALTSQEQQGQEHGLNLPTSATTPSSKLFRVKVYRKTSEGEVEWQYQGTGICTYKTGDNDQEPDRIFVQNEKDGSPLLTSQVLIHREYKKQQEKLILWLEDTENLLALSFQKRDGCDHIWNLIPYERRISATDNRLRTSTEQQQRQKREIMTMQAEAVGEMMDTGISDNVVKQRPTVQADSAAHVNAMEEQSKNKSVRTPPMTNESQEVATLPMPERINLDEIINIISSAKTSQDKKRLASFIVQENYIDKLVSAFDSWEDLESIEDLHKLYTIMKSVILLNDNTIIEQIVRDKSVMGVLGILEYDPKIPGKKPTHRTDLAVLSQYEPIVPIENKRVDSTMQQTLRLKYLQDVILGDAIDDSLATILHDLICVNYIDIINYFENNHEYLKKMFQIFKDEDSSDEMKKEASTFVIQLCVMAKVLTEKSRVALTITLAHHGLFNMLPFALFANDEVLRTHATDVLDLIVRDNPYLLREFTILQTRTTGAENTTLCAVLKRFALDDTDSGLRIQYAGIIKALMDLGYGERAISTKAAERLHRQNPVTALYVDVFYEGYLDLFLRPFEQVDVKPIKLDGPVEELELTQDQSDICLKLCDLICFVIRQHSMSSKILLSTDCFVKIAQLYRCKQPRLKLAALRVFRTCVGQSDESYTRHLIKLNVFEPTIRVLLDTGGRDNGLNSACLEMLEYIRKENIKLLVEHLVSNYGSVLDTIDYVKPVITYVGKQCIRETICKMLRLRHEQNVEPNYQQREEQTTTTSTSSSSSSLPDSNKNSNNNNGNNAANNNKNTTATIADIAEVAVSKSSSPSPTLRTTTTAATTTTESEEQQEERALSPPPALSRRRKYEDDNEDHVSATRTEREIKKRKHTPPPTSLGTTTTAAAAAVAEEEQQAECAVSPPPPPLSRRRKHEDDDEDHVSAEQTGREKKKRKHTPPPSASLGTTTTTSTAPEGQQAERTMSPAPPSMRMMTRAMYRQHRLEEKKRETERTSRPLVSSKASPKKTIVNPQIRKLRSNSK